jgi:cyclohexanecarboxylate-CoA ligase
MKRQGAAVVLTSSQHSDLWTLVERRAVDHAAARLAIDESGRSLTFSDLRTKADRVAAGLAARGVTSGARVTWQLPNSLDAIVLIAALSRIGAVQNPVLPLYGRRELTFICEQFDPHLVIVPAQWRGIDYAASGRALTAGAERNLLVLDSGLPEGEPPPDLRGDAPATGDVRWVFYTSGTSGEPKGVCHSDASLAVSASTMCDRLEACRPRSPRRIPARRHPPAPGSTTCSAPSSSAGP